MSLNFDEITPNLWLPLPHPENTIDVDVFRLRDALSMIDAACASLSALAATKASEAAVSTALNALQDGINNLIAHKVGNVNGLPGPVVTLKPAHLGLGPANGPASMSVTYDGSGRVSTATSAVDGKASVQSVTYDGSGRVSAVTTTYDGHTRTETYTYNPNGTVASMAAVEI